MSVECDIGLIGLAVMGQNLVLNIESRGFRVAVYNRTASVTQGFVAKHAGKALDAYYRHRDEVHENLYTYIHACAHASTHLYYVCSTRRLPTQPMSPTQRLPVEARELEPRAPAAISRSTPFP
jgi:outer membrane receptor for Fe3+-dicitrate